MLSAFFPALEREKHTNMELEKQRLSAEEENARQRAKPTNWTREKHDHKRAKPARKREWIPGVFQIFLSL